MMGIFIVWNIFDCLYLSMIFDVNGGLIVFSYVCYVSLILCVSVCKFLDVVVLWYCFLFRKLVDCGREGIMVYFYEGGV